MDLGIGEKLLSFLAPPTPQHLRSLEREAVELREYVVEGGSIVILHVRCQHLARVRQRR